MLSSPITLELERPSTLAGRTCGPLACWFIALLVSRARSGAGPRSVNRAELRAQLRTDGAYPMALSRLFATARAVGIDIGWGAPERGDASLCDTRRRRDGPFWISRATALRLRVTRDGQAIDGAALRRWLQARSHSSRPLPVPASYTEQAGAARFWFDLLLARQQAEEDGGSTPSASARRRPAVPPLAALAEAAMAPVQRGWALFALARQARRADDLATARHALQQAAQDLRHATDARSQALQWLCKLGLAWCAYQARDVATAQRLLDRSFFGSGEAWRHNPRLCAEVLNLRGLLRRSRLAARWPRMPAADDVADVLADFEAALVAAIEADAFTLMEGVVSNLGYSIWLLRVAPGVTEPSVADAHRLDAMRWILLSEWYRQRHALSGQSLWNVLSVCRIARGGLALGTVDGPETVDHSTALALSTVRRELAPLGELLHAGDPKAAWHDVTSRLLAELHDAPAAHGRLESAAVMLEHLWQLVPEGAAAPATLALVRDLRRGVATLAAADQVMFERELQRIEARWEISSPPTRAARPTRASRRHA